MKNSINPQNREKLTQIMIASLQKEMQSINPNLQSILIDDLITAFYNRLVVLEKFC